MRAESRATVESSWAEIFGCERDSLWRGAQVRRHSGLGDYPGFFTAWRDTGVHVSLPSSVSADEAESLATQGFDVLTGPAFWASVAAERGWVLLGPAVHTYLDRDPGDDGSSSWIDPARLDVLRAAVTDEEWLESGLETPKDVLAIFSGDRLVAAANLTDFGGAARQIGVLVAADLRGQGLGLRVGRAAASHAIRSYGFAAWRARTANEPSLAISAGLGFESYAQQLAVRPARD